MKRAHSGGGGGGGERGRGREGRRRRWSVRGRKTDSILRLSFSFPFSSLPFHPLLVPLSLRTSTYISLASFSFSSHVLPLFRRCSSSSSSSSLSLSLSLSLCLCLCLCLSLPLLAIASHPLQPVFPFIHPSSSSRSRLEVFLCRWRASLSLSLSLSLASLVPPFPRLSGFLPGLFLLLPAASHPTLFKPRRPRACLSAPARLPRPCSRRRPWCPLFEALLFFLAAFTAPGLHPCPRSIRRGLSVGGGLPPPPAENSSKNIHSTTAGNTSMLVTERVPNVDWKRRRMEREGRLTENE